MPQLWLTYEELADQLSCTPEEARSVALDRSWSRKRSRDGHSRVLLPRDLMRAYIAKAARHWSAVDEQADVMTDRLRSVLPGQPSDRRQATG